MLVALRALHSILMNTNSLYELSSTNRCIWCISSRGRSLSLQNQGKNWKYQMVWYWRTRWKKVLFGFPFPFKLITLRLSKILTFSWFIVQEIKSAANIWGILPSFFLLMVWVFDVIVWYFKFLPVFEHYEARLLSAIFRDSVEIINVLPSFIHHYISNAFWRLELSACDRHVNLCILPSFVLAHNVLSWNPAHHDHC